MDSVTIVKASTEHIPAIHQLVRELAIYERAEEQHTATIEDYTKDFSSGLFDALVAIKDAQVIGVAFYYTAYSTWKGKMLFLEDFLVTERYRKSGVGQLLFNEFIEEGKRANAKLLKWQVLDWNEPAIQFYQKNNASIEKEWWNGKLFLP